MGTLLPRIRRPLEDDRGTSAVEFALVLPSLCLLLVGTIDFGTVLYTHFRLNSAVASGSNFVLVNSDDVTSTGGAALATSIAAVLKNGAPSATSTSGKVVVNNGPTVTLTNGTASSSGTASNADLCYCPTGSTASLVWGTSKTCQSACTGGGVAGKFVLITATQAYTPSFSNYGLVQNGTVTTSALVQAQ